MTGLGPFGDPSPGMWPGGGEGRGACCCIPAPVSGLLLGFAFPPFQVSTVQGGNTWQGYGDGLWHLSSCAF